MSQKQTAQAYQQLNDEIDLADLWQTIKRRKWTIFATAGAVLALALVYLTMATPIYETSVKVYLGTFNGTPLEQSTLLAARLDAQYGKEVKRRTGASSWIEKTGTDKADKRLFEVTVRGLQAAEVQHAAKTIVDGIIAEHESMLKSSSQMLREELQQLEALAKSGRGALDAASSARVGDSVQRLNLWAAMMYSSGELAGIQTRIAELRNTLDGSKTMPTRVIRAPVEPDNPVHPKIMLTLVLALFAGGMFALILVFVSEALSRPCVNEDRVTE